jgi:hypothetical protein
MGHNLSQRAARNSVLATPIGRYSTCILVLTCPSCRERRELRIEPLIAYGRGAETTERFLMRLRCRSVPERAASVEGGAGVAEQGDRACRA